MNYHDYIWDLGGTLLDNYQVSTKSFIKALSIFNKQAFESDVYQELKVSTQSAIDRFASDQSDFLQVYKSIEAQGLEEPILFAGAREVLAKSVAQGSRNFLISHRNKQVLNILDKAEIAPYFTEVITSENGFDRKPSPQAFVYLKDKYHLDNALVIGDRDIDIQAGEAVGFDTLLFDGNKSLMEIIN